MSGKNSTIGSPTEREEMKSICHTEEITGDGSAGPSQCDEARDTPQHLSTLSASGEDTQLLAEEPSPESPGVITPDMEGYKNAGTTSGDLEAQLEAGLFTALDPAEKLSEHDEDEGNAEQPSTPGEAETDVPTPQVGSSHASLEEGRHRPHTPSDEMPGTPGKDSPQNHVEEAHFDPTEKPPDQEQSHAEEGSRDTTSQPPSTPDTVILANTGKDATEDEELGASKEQGKDCSPEDNTTHLPLAPGKLQSEAPILDERLSDTLKPELPFTPHDEPPFSPFGKLLRASSVESPQSPGTGLSRTPKEESTVTSHEKAPLQPVLEQTTETGSRETTAQLPDAVSGEDRADVEKDASTLVDSLHGDKSPYVEDEPEASPGTSTHEIISKLPIADDASSVKAPRNVSGDLLVELSAYLAASPVTQRSDAQPLASYSEDEPTEGLANKDNDGRTSAAHPGITDTDEATSNHVEGQSYLAHIADGAPEQDVHINTDESGSLPDYESQPDAVDEVPEVCSASEDSQGKAVQCPQIDVVEPTPLLPPKQGETSPSNSAPAADKRRRSAGDTSPGRVNKRIRIVLKRTPSPQPPTGQTVASSSSAVATEANKRRRSLSDPGPQRVIKRPRIVLKRTPSPLPPQQRPQESPRSLRSRESEALPSLAWMEDQISPKTVPPAPAIPDRTRASSKKSARKAKGLPLDKPSTSGLTWSAVESLLPASVFGQASWIRRRFWTVKEEIDLRTAWSEADEAALNITDSEVLVGRFVPRLYGCRLQDLFRYGLKYIAPPADRNGNPSDEPFWTHLLRLLPHPFFLGKIEILRYTLQQAISFRTSNFAADNFHVPAYMPPWSHKEPSYITYLKDVRSQYPEGSPGWDAKTLEIIEASEFRCKTQVENKMWMQELCEVMGGWAEYFAAQFAPPQGQGVGEGEVAVADGPLGMYLFVLTERDLAFVECCLDHLDREQRKRQSERAQTWQERHAWNEYAVPGEIPHVEEHRGYHRADVEFAIHPELQPPPPQKNVALEAVTVESAFLKLWTTLSPKDGCVAPEQRAEYAAEKRLAVLAERREALIRQKASAAKGSTQGGGRVVLDVPPFDPDPGFQFFDNRDKFSKWPGLMVIRGSYLTPATREWLYHWTRQRWEEQVTKDPAYVPDSAVGRVLGGGYLPAGIWGPGAAGPSFGQPTMAVSEGAVGGDEYGNGDWGGDGGVIMADRSSVVKQHAEYSRRHILPPILSMGGGLWARRKGKRVAKQ